MPTLTDDEKRRMLSEGAAIQFGAWPEAELEGPELREARVIQATWIKELLDAEDTIRVPIQIDNAVIRGDLRLEYATFQRSVSITNTAFDGEVDLSFATFKRTACFAGSVFRKPANLHDIHAERDLEVTAASFKESASFSDSLVGGFFQSKRAKYGSVTFERAVVSKGAYFHKAEFLGEVLFSGTQIKGQALFTGARFHGRALFIKTTFDHDAVFSAVEFAKEVAFDGSTVAKDFVLIPDPQAQQPVRTRGKIYGYPGER